METCPSWSPFGHSRLWASAVALQPAGFCSSHILRASPRSSPTMREDGFRFPGPLLLEQTSQRGEGARKVSPVPIAIVIPALKSGIPGDPHRFLQLSEREGGSRSRGREPGGSALCKNSLCYGSGSPPGGLGASGPGAFSGRVPSQAPAAVAHLPPRCSRGPKSLGGVRFRLQITSEL